LLGSGLVPPTPIMVPSTANILEAVGR
jgi:hypothetical protein